jgi:hypothetical protein
MPSECKLIKEQPHDDDDDDDVYYVIDHPIHKFSRL